MLNIFIDQKKKTFKKSAEVDLFKDAHTILVNFCYPGNIRELENLIERLYVFNEGAVEAETIPRFVKKNDNEKSLLLKDVEKHHIKYVMELYSGNQSRSAEALGVIVNTLKSKIEKYGLEREDFI